jgi:hypothetical protein
MYDMHMLSYGVSIHCPAPALSGRSLSRRVTGAASGRHPRSTSGSDPREILAAAASQNFVPRACQSCASPQRRHKSWREPKRRQPRAVPSAIC